MMLGMGKPRCPMRGCGPTMLNKSPDITISPNIEAVLIDYCSFHLIECESCMMDRVGILVLAKSVEV